MMSKEELFRIGSPFEIKVTVTADTTDNSFVLSSSDYDWNGDGTDETTPFSDYSLYITGLNLSTGSLTGTVKVILDDHIIYSETASAAAVTVAWDGTGSNPKLEDVFGDFLICRDEIKVTKSAAPDAAGTLILRGVAVPKRLL